MSHEGSKEHVLTIWELYQQTQIHLPIDTRPWTHRLNLQNLTSLLSNQPRVGSEIKPQTSRPRM
jgi:hypothetical protein